MRFVICFIKNKAISKKGLIAKTGYKQKKNLLIPNINQFFALNYAAHLLNRFASKKN